MSQTLLKQTEKIVARMKKRAREKDESVPHIYMDTLNDIVCCWTLNYYKHYCNVINYILYLFIV